MVSAAEAEAASEAAETEEGTEAQVGVVLASELEELEVPLRCR